MSEAKFTPGPWKISRHGELVEIPEISGILLCAGNATANANAALIAAAPELYAALEGFVEWVQSPLAFSEGERVERAVKVMAYALAALARAKGE